MWGFIYLHLVTNNQIRAVRASVWDFRHLVILPDVLFFIFNIHKTDENRC